MRWKIENEGFNVQKKGRTTKKTGGLDKIYPCVKLSRTTTWSSARGCSFDKG